MSSGYVSEAEYGDARLAGWPWADIYPCPITGCWLYALDNAPASDATCGQPSCCNPAHGGAVPLTPP